MTRRIRQPASRCDESGATSWRAAAWSGLLLHVRLGLQQHFRNRMAVLYGFVFPLVFLLAFRVLYRHEPAPLLRHAGEWLTVTVLGGACFGLPTTLVSERERGLWRRFRLTPVPTCAFVLSTALARYILLLAAGGLQLAAAVLLSMPVPEHPLALLVAFSFASFALVGLGLLIAMLADSVPAIQALGQCLFLPLLMIGGVAVPLAQLPAWAQHLSAFFPGRYAVSALQDVATGPGGDSAMNLLALAASGGAAIVAATILFRWDVGQAFFARRDKRWVLLALVGWIAVGVVAEYRRTAVVSPGTPPTPGWNRAPKRLPPAVTAKSAGPTAPWQQSDPEGLLALHPWVPPDDGIVAPLARTDAGADPDTAAALGELRQRLMRWEPGLVADDAQRAHNLLAVAALVDIARLPIEPYVPHVILRLLRRDYAAGDLARLLAWVAVHPNPEGSVTDLSDLGLDAACDDPALIEQRVHYYAIKLLSLVVADAPS